MFATTDKWTDRFLTAEARDLEGRAVFIRADQALGLIRPKLRERLLIKPEKRLLRMIGMELLQLNYVLADPPNIKNYLKKIVQNSKGADRAEWDRRLRLPLYEFITYHGSRFASRETIQLSKVKLQMWRVRYFHDQNRIRCETMGVPIEVGRPV